ncbi:hypothetical protein ACFLRQ_03150 [Bacteroidota bacterium]
MKVKIYKKICLILQVVEVKDDEGYIEKYVLESRDNKKAAWKDVFESPSLKKTLAKKHFYTHFAIRHLGYGEEFLKRKKKRKARRDREEKEALMKASIESQDNT